MLRKIRVISQQKSAKRGASLLNPIRRVLALQPVLVRLAFN